MWELERKPATTSSAGPLRHAIVGAGRLGNALAAGLREAGLSVDGPLGRGARCTDADVVLLCVPDGEIANAAATLAPRSDGNGPLVGHCSGATTLDVLAPHEAFSLHPLMTVPADGPTRWTGASAAIAGTTTRARATARELALQLGLTPIDVAEEDRAAYHAAASIASNFLVTLEAAAEQLAGSAGVDRQALLPLVRTTVENWAILGPEQALTGPIARGDEATVARQREALRERTPHLLPLFDTLAEATRALASGERSARRGIEGEDADRAGGAGKNGSATPLADRSVPATGPARSSARSQPAGAPA
jgi:predicted short-subunit dehydrogenase-like oxidoreductase (DUF2520 family)